MLAISASDSKAAIVSNVIAATSVTEIAPGLLDIRISLPKDAKDADIFLFTVSYQVGGVTHSGSSLFSHQANRNLGS